MAITQISNVASNTEGQVVTGDKTVGKDDFLHLLVTQLQNQDPMNPMESAEFSAQLAQFSSLEQLTNINDGMGLLVEQQSASNTNQAVNFIGKQVKAEGSTIEVVDGAADDFYFELAGNAAETVAYIYDMSGRVVKMITMGGYDAGEQSGAWDATDQNDAAVDDGVYSFEVVAMGPEGEPVQSTPFISAAVTGVSFESGSAMLMAGKRKISMDNVIAVEHSAAAASPLGESENDGAQTPQPTDEADNAGVPAGDE
jgi:flagellar basal-body rod modification protein FlgD